MSGYLELKGKRALVTGGTKGVGAAVADAARKQLNRQGHNARQCCATEHEAELRQDLP